ncbi:MAG: type I-C CRISPR-associated protein Cas8c/Csd1, partial [Oscillospiraceae bacterium]|nr:type I-C CRISPR-associated protein Cas8c/Csd1 [Oscillospiraceae bacterium]
MSWMNKLCEAYDSAIEADQSGESNPLIPVGFTQKEIKYHIVLSESGEFVSAEEWNAKTFQIVPSSPEAESRTGANGTPFPLADQLKYLVSEEGSNPRFQKYMEQLSAWCGMPEAPECLSTLKRYLEQGTLLSDLTDKAHLKVKYYKDAADKNDYGPDAKTFAVFSVQSPLDDEQGDELWMRKDVRESWAAYLDSSRGEGGVLCYVEGRRRHG